MHMGSIAIFEGAPLLDEDGALRLDDLRALIASRLALVPKLRQYPVPGFLGQAPPTWADDAAFDITQHVRQRQLPAPGTEAQLREACGDLLATPLRTDRPLWELVFVTGLDDGRVALVEKLHHAVADGIAAAELATVLLDLAPAMPPFDDSATWEPGAPRSCVTRALQDILSLTKISLRLPEALGAAMVHPIRSTRAALGFGAALVPMLPLRLIAPRSSLNNQISQQREVHFVRAPLERVHGVAQNHGATINDVLLSAISGGLRDILDKRGELDRTCELQALVPVGLDTQRKRTSGNGVSAYFVRLPIAEPDPARALAFVSRETKAQKGHHEELVPGSALRLLDPVPQGVLGEAARLLRRQPFFNLIVTNVPGPPVPLYALGARMLEVFPIVPLLGNQGLGVAALSYVDTFAIGVLSNPDVVPDVEIFCHGVVRTLAALDDPNVPIATDHRP